MPRSRSRGIAAPPSQGRIFSIYRVCLDLFANASTVHQAVRYGERGATCALIMRPHDQCTGRSALPVPYRRSHHFVASILNQRRRHLMKRTPLLILTAIVFALLASSLLWNFSMQAAGPAGRGARQGGAANDQEDRNFDIRNKYSKDAILKFERRLEKLSPRQKGRNDSFKLAMRGARERKAMSVPELEVAFSDLTNSPQVVQGRSRGRKFLTPPSSQPRESVVRSFINENPDVFGMNPQQVARLRKS